MQTDEKSKAGEVLKSLHKKEKELKLIPAKVSKNTTIMVSPTITNKELVAKMRKYKSL